MKKYTVKRYEPKDHSDWNAFISTSKNSTFLFNRDFMEYHSDQFEDYSLLIYDEGKLVSVLPANRVGDAIYSHQGLTYGGLVFQKNIKLGNTIPIFQEILLYLNENQIEKLNLKLIPSIYCDGFSEEIEYSLFLLKAKLTKRDCLSVLDLTKPFFISKTRKESIRRGIKNDLIIKEELNFELFWKEILIPNLDKKHNAKPVHSAEEMIKLQKLFPDNIRHFNVYKEGNIVAGTTIFVSENVAHPQYISGNIQKNELGSLDYLYDYLINVVYKDKNFFDFGPSHENNGLNINEGILFWKESFGAKTSMQDSYEIETNNYKKLAGILI
ncbi:MAG: hypothetical protein RL308_2889 [Bacteroidota bacterium]